MRQCSKCGRRFDGGETVCPDDGTLLADSVTFEEQAVGKTLDGKYRVDGFLKRGGMGAVYRGTHVMLNKPVAIKLIKPELVSSTDVVQRFLREARAAARLSHPNIVTVHDLGQTSDGMLYIAMELVDGKSLKEIIVADGAWEPKRALRLLNGIGSALALAHREGIVHRDLKPQNIMVSRDSDGNEIPKLLDFGIAKTFEPTSPALTSTGMVLGTPHYMSSEQAKGLPADQRSDLYALGVILYEMLVGKVPFDDASIPQILIKHLSEPPKPPTAMGANIPGELEAAVLRCLEKDPEKRFQSAEELMRALDTVPDTAEQPPPLPTVAMTTEPAAATVPDESTRPTRDATMAGAAAAAVPSSTGTIRAHEVHAGEKSNASRFLILGIAIVAIALVALLLLRGFRGRDRAPAEASEPVTAAASAAGETAAEPAREPAAAAGEPVDEGGETADEPDAGETRAAPTPAQTAPADPPEPAPAPASPAAPVQAEAPPPPPPPPLPEIPVTALACEGVRDGCSALRYAIVEEARKQGMRVARPPRGDVVVRLDVEEIEARNETQFGTTFVVRTYSVEAGGGSRHFDDELYLEPKMITFDARLGREKLRERARVIASDIVAAVQDYWSQHRGR